MCFNTFANLTIIGGTVYMGKIEQHQNTSAKLVRVCLGWHPCCFQTTHGRLWGADVGCRPQPVPRRWASREGLPAFPNEATRQISAAQDSNPEDCQVSVTAISLQAWTSALWKNQIRHTLSFLFRTCWFSTRTMWADYFHLNVLETKAKNHERIEVPKALLVAHLSKDFTCNWAAYFIFFFNLCTRIRLRNGVCLFWSLCIITPARGFVSFCHTSYKAWRISKPFLSISVKLLHRDTSKAISCISAATPGPIWSCWSLCFKYS